MPKWLGSPSGILNGPSKAKPTVKPRVKKAVEEPPKNDTKRNSKEITLVVPEVIPDIVVAEDSNDSESFVDSDRDSPYGLLPIQVFSFFFLF